MEKIKISHQLCVRDNVFLYLLPRLNFHNQLFVSVEFSSKYQEENNIMDIFEMEIVLELQNFLYNSLHFLFDIVFFYSTNTF